MLITCDSVRFGTYHIRWRGVGSCRSAIQAALDYVAGGGVVRLSAGVYEVAPPDLGGNIFTIPGPGIRITGAGPGLTTIRVVGGMVPYASVFGSPALATDLSGLVLEELTVDHNVEAYPIGSLAELVAAPRMTLRSDVGHGKRVRRVEILNASSINDFYLGGDDLAVENCTWRGCGDDPDHVSHDHSAVYLTGRGLRVTDCNFEGTSLGCPGACTAIETHGPGQIVSRNTVKNYMQVANITGVYNGESALVSVEGNIGSGLAVGLHLWSQAYGAHVAGNGLAQVSVQGNTFDLAETGSWPTGVVHGILVEHNSTLDVSGLLVRGNVIRSPIETEIRAANGASVGIGWYSTTGKTYRRSLMIDNVIEGFPLAGIRLSCAVQDVVVAHNVLVNVGGTLDPTVANAYKTPLFVGAPNGAVDGLWLRDNVIVDSLGRNTYGMYLLAEGAQRFYSLGNSISGSGTPVYLDGTTLPLTSL